jgi:hypothetical protein
MVGLHGLRSTPTRPIPSAAILSDAFRTESLPSSTTAPRSARAPDLSLGQCGCKADFDATISSNLPAVLAGRHPSSENEALPRKEWLACQKCT